MYYTKLTDDDVAITYGLFRFLEKLRIIGHIIVHTETPPDLNMGEVFGDVIGYSFNDDGYTLVKDGYTREPRKLDAIEEIERVLNREFKMVNPSSD